MLLVLGALTAVGAFSFDMYLPSFPEMARDLDATTSAIQLTLTACLVGMAFGNLFVGPLSDRYGRKRPAMIATAAYALSSLGCVLATNVESLTVIRLVQGLSAGAGTVLARSVVRDLYSGDEAARFFSRLSLVFGLAPILAPTLGALLLKFTSWRGVFVFLTGLGVALLLVTWRGLPETLPVERRRSGGFGEFAAGARLVATDRIFLGYTLAGGLTFAALFAYLSSSSFVLQDVFGVSPQTYGLIFGINSLGLVLAGQLNARLVGRHTPRRLLFSALIAGLGATSLALVGSGLSAAVLVIPMLFFYISCIGMIMPNGFALGLERHPATAGTAAALMGAMQSAIGLLAAPLVGAFGAASGVPMAAVMCGFASLALVVTTAMTRKGPLLA
ncbi:DHA1 family bicyclomycin/chloramphenicol resistance-like MFS transporter [Allocatelliglobosispora scoriae]|uniref:DHA1 family bicyclomycin/chloramphenicol resistance-like MFS transporter n=1 Tax=Allocatelliglobosispora scoriae TaxID=643052 RepID=A0A841C2D5_9ACTN|nr:multidrug effflux MFS transporter [Allocatelliglobosispora scoriae]MBB5873130.1 DHA1 family bicyclomycin/chloramphenicol resistance-like MFS transporter [Allocatelliglobosispora scoriae]